jgi:hypothetical protein
VVQFESAGELGLFRGFAHYSGRSLTEILALACGFLFWLLSLLVGLMVGVSLFAIFGHESIMLQNRGLNSNCTTTSFSVGLRDLLGHSKQTARGGPVLSGLRFRKGTASAVPISQGDIRA